MRKHSEAGAGASACFMKDVGSILAPVVRAPCMASSSYSVPIWFNTPHACGAASFAGLCVDPW